MGVDGDLESAPADLIGAYDRMFGDEAFDL